MNSIRVLDKTVAEMIAAGEVVERPASAVKELLENAVDAGATVITAEIKNGGIPFIRITDNGCGISKEDLPFAFLRHATSKIARAEDLEAIGTLGFRGEALASIAAVSKVEMMTRTAQELSGSRIALEGGEVVSQGDAGCPQGTTVIVRELFYNTPARMKFLKKDVTEGNAVHAVVERIALSHPEISFKFIRDGREELHTPGDNRLISAVHAVLGKEFAKSLLPVEYELNGLRVGGFVSRPADTRANRNMQYFFLNGRLVRSKTVMAALEEAYKGSIMAGRFPGCVLHIHMSPALVDVNVHPAKIEVRFSSERQVFDAVYYAVKNALAACDDKPQLHLPQTAGPRLPDLSAGAPHEQLGLGKAPLPEYIRSRQETPQAVADSTVRTAYHAIPGGSLKQEAVTGGADAPCGGIKLPDGAQTIDRADGQGQAAAAQTSAGAEERPAKAGGDAFRVVGECFNTYIIVQTQDELLLIDKHAAHERIIYEQLRRQGQACAQQLLEPLALTLTSDEHGTLIENAGLLENLGFILEDFGGTALLVRAAPLYLEPGLIESAVCEIADCLIANKKNLTPKVLEDLYHSVACRAAVKGGDKTGLEEDERLAARVLASDDIRYCPHGRPVAVALRRSEIEKQFGRTG